MLSQQTNSNLNGYKKELLANCCGPNIVFHNDQTWMKKMILGFHRADVAVVERQIINTF